MFKKLIAIPVALTALAFAAAASAAPGGGATVVRDEGCVQTPFALVCTTVKTTTSTTTTPSGKTSYVTNGTVDRTMTFVFGGSYTTSSKLHVNNLLADGEFMVSSDHYEETSEYVSGTYHLLCTNSYDIHWAGGQAQYGNYVLECTVL
jgi:hypothetical protein